MANTAISNAAAIVALDSLVDLIDVGAGTSVVEIYDGTQPAGPDEAVGAQNLLASFDLPNPAFGAATDAAPGAEASANAIAATTVDTTGTASWFRAKDGDGLAIIDGDVSATGGGGDMQLNTVSLEAAANIEITGWTITHPE